jgi:hypothetical protein
MIDVARGLVAGLITSSLVGAGVWALAVGIRWRTGDSITALSRLCDWLYQTQIGTAIRESQYVFPIIEGSHLLGIALSVGALCWFDLRLIGVAFQRQRVSHVWKQVMPFAGAGFVLMFLTGALLFWAEARVAYHSVHFWIKLALLGLAGLNALAYEMTKSQSMSVWDDAAVPPLRVRLAGYLSLLLWTAIIVTGRTMAYTF